jgi:hypothetical protein
LTVVTGKDFNIKLGYIPRKRYDNDEFVFIPVGANDFYERMRKADKELIAEGFGDSLFGLNKPNGHEGLWVSPCHENFSVWAGACVDLGFTGIYADTYYEVIPHDDCRILIIDSLEEYIKFEKEFDFQWDFIAKEYDMIFLNSITVMNPAFLFKTPDIKPKYRLMLYGWDCVSGVFLNEKFTLGERHKYDHELSNSDYRQLV